MDQLADNRSQKARYTRRRWLIDKPPGPLNDRHQTGPAREYRRKVRKLSQEKLAEHADVHRNYIGLIERGEQNITIESLVKVAKALKCKVMDLVVGAGI